MASDDPLAIFLQACTWLSAQYHADATFIFRLVFGLSVTFISGSGVMPSVLKRSFCKITAKTATASITAKALPMHTRGPAPKGI